MLPEFEFLKPGSVADALAMLAGGSPDVLPVAGGTNVIPDLRGARHHPRALVDIAGLAELRYIRRENGHVVIGGGTTLSDLLASPLVAETAPALHAAAGLFANPLVRNRATVAGNLVDASPAADTAPPLLALGALVELSSAGGTRCLPLEDFLVGVRQTLRRPDELLTAIRWPVPAPGVIHGQAYYKLGLRRADAISVLSVAVVLESAAGGRCLAAHIALGAVAPRPLRAYRAEEALAGQVMTPEVMAHAADLAAEAARPISDIRGSAAYRQGVTAVVTRRLLAQAAAAGSPA